MICAFCDEEIGPDDQYDQRIACPPGVGYHEDCKIRAVVGSLGHQLGLCGCKRPRSIMDDPPGLTRREAARAAAAMWRKRSPTLQIIHLPDVEDFETDPDAE